MDYNKVGDKVVYGGASESARHGRGNGPWLNVGG